MHAWVMFEYKYNVRIRKGTKIGDFFSGWRRDLGLGILVEVDSLINLMGFLRLCCFYWMKGAFLDLVWLSFYRRLFHFLSCK